MIHQQTYIKRLWKKFNMKSLKSNDTPIAIATKLDLDEEGKDMKQELYRGMRGSLLNLTASRPDILFRVGLCSRFQANPKKSHLKEVKRILRYLKRTPDLCTWYPRGYNFDLVGYAYANYAGFQPIKTPAKLKSSSKPGSKSKSHKAKPKKNVKSSIFSTPPPVVPPPPSSSVFAPPPIIVPLPPSSDVSAPPPIIDPLPLPLKTTTQSTSSTPQITSKPTKVKATSQKSVKSVKQVDSATNKGEPVMKDPTSQGKAAIYKDSQVKLSPSKHDVLASTIDVSPLDVVEPLREIAQAENHVAEKVVVAQHVSEEVFIEQTDSEEDEETNKGVDVESDKEHQSEEKKSENVGESEEEKVEHDGKSEEEKETEGECGSDSEKVMVALEDVNVEEASEEPRPSLAPFLGDEDIESNMDDLPLSEVGKKVVANPTITPLTSSKRKVVGEELIKEAKSDKRTRKSVTATKIFVQMDVDKEHVSSLKGKKSSAKRIAIKPVKATTSSSQKKIKGKKKTDESKAVDRMADFKSRNFDVKVLKSSVRKFELQFDAEELGLLLNIPSLGFDHYLKKKWPAIDNDVDIGVVVTESFPKSLS
nr:nucleolar and coiled-body phosphoprotein 1-like [Nicotiana tomentosiformis]